MRVPRSALIDNGVNSVIEGIISYAGEITAVTDQSHFTCAALALELAEYTGHRLKFVSGNMAGHTCVITRHFADALTIDTPVGAALVAGDRFIILSLKGPVNGLTGPTPDVGMVMIGMVSPDQVGNTTIIDIPNLAGFPSTVFDGGNWAMTVLSAGGAAPEGETRAISTGGIDGVFTTAAFSANVEANDIVCIYYSPIVGPSNLAKPTLSFFEGWQDEAGMDGTVWTWTDPATGAAWARGAIGELLMAYAAPNANESCRLRSNQRWVVSPDLYGATKILQSFNLEFEMHAVGAANFDNVTFLMGLTPAVADVRTTNNIIGFALTGAGNALETLTDAGGAETTATGFGENLLVTNKLRIEAFRGHVRFYLNDVMIADHTTNLPSNAPLYVNLFAPTGVGGAATFRVGNIRIWTEDRL